MKSFKDTQNSTWRVELTLGSMKRVKDELGVDLMRLDQEDEHGNPLVARLIDDDYLIGSILEVLLRDQPGFDQLLNSMDGETTQAAYEAFQDALQDFFLKRGRVDKATALRKTREVMGEMVKEICRNLEQTPGPVPGSLPGLSE